MNIQLNENEIKEIEKTRAKPQEKSPKRPVGPAVMQYDDYIDQAVESGQMSRGEGIDSSKANRHKQITS